MVWQRAGTVSVQTGSNTVVGTNVDFAASSRNGDSFIGPDGVNYEVANVASSTVISILPAYKGPTVSGAAYAIMPVQGYDKMLSDAFNALNNQFGAKLAALGTTGNYDVLPVAKGGTGGASSAAARTGLGLGTAATANLIATLSDPTASRVLLSGYCGLGALDNAVFVGSSLDPNSFRVGGTFLGQFTIAGFGGMSGALLVGAGSANTVCTQNFTSWGDGQQYNRAQNGGTWAPWRKQYDTSNTTRAADGTLKAI